MMITTKAVLSIDQLSPRRRWWLIHADSDYIAARTLYGVGVCYLRTLGLCHEALEKYMKLFLVLHYDVPDEEIDAYLQKEQLRHHNLVKLREACFEAAQGDLRPTLVFGDANFTQDVEVIETLRYAGATRYPDWTVVTGESVQIFDRLIYNVRQDCLNAVETPLQIVFEKLGSGPGWPSPRHLAYAWPSCFAQPRDCPRRS